MKKISELRINGFSSNKNSKKFLTNITSDLSSRKFLFAANSRSGHNFARVNILSWFGLKQPDDIDYRNLENYHLTNFKSGIEKLPAEIYDESIKVLMLRDLLNWYTSYFYLFLNLIKERSFILEDESPLSTRIINKKTKTYRLVHFKNQRIKKIYLKTYTLKEIKLTNQMRVGLDTWLENAKEFKKDTNILEGFTHIYYDKFFVDQDYRKSICSDLGGEYNEEKLNKVPSMGNFSTFDSNDYQDKGQDMKKVLGRYKNWKDEHKKYLDMMFNHDAFQYYLDNFEVSDEKKSFINAKNKN